MPWSVDGAFASTPTSSLWSHWADRSLTSELEQAHLLRGLREVIAGIRMRGLMNEVLRLIGLGAPKAVGDALLGRHGAVLEAGDRLIDQRHDGRDVRLRVPGRQRHEGLSSA